MQTDLFEAFAADASSMVLFLKNVEEIEILTWAADAAAPALVHRVAIDQCNAALRAERGSVVKMVEVARALEAQRREKDPDNARQALVLEAYSTVFSLDIVICTGQGDQVMPPSLSD